jgi:pimeloyl-ACP methyl ester carboxylesterase
MPFANVNGVRLFYTDDPGAGPPLLLIHGWTCDSCDWSWQIDAFAGAHRVVAPDLRGHGRSETGNTHDLPTFAEDLVALLDALGTGPVVVVAHSLGGAIASVLAVEHSEHVRALVTVDPGIGVGPGHAELVDAVEQQVSGPQAGEFLGHTFAAMEGPSAAAGLAVWHRRRALAFPSRFLAETWRAQVDSGLLYRPSADAYLVRRTCPVLTIYTDPERAGWEAELLSHPHSRAMSWPGSGHWLHQERPLEFNRLVLDWLAALLEPEPAVDGRGPEALATR